MSSGPALGGQGLPLIPFNQACYGTKLAGASHTCRSSQHYRQQDHTFVGSAVPYDARRRGRADHRQDRILSPARGRRLKRQTRTMRSVITHIAFLSIGRAGSRHKPTIRAKDVRRIISQE